jgi:hypothetical protein
MRPDSARLLVLASVVAFGGPALLALRGVSHAYRNTTLPQAQRSPWNWRLTIASTLICTLAFNLIFLVQELALVVSKALTPGLHPILYHNNHDWTGDNPLARLEQGTGALATLLLGLAALWWLGARNSRSTSRRLFGIWLAFHGLFASLPQVVIGAVLPQNDVGMAMDYLRLGPATLMLSALAALAAMAATGTWLARPIVALAGNPAEIGNAAQKVRFVFRTATIPTFASLPLIVAFRVPGEIVQVAIVPVVITCLGIIWVQAAAWAAPVPPHVTERDAPRLPAPLTALIIALLFFQLVLRRGIAF